MIFLTAKNVAIFLGIASIAFCVSTIVLAVDKAQLESDLEDALNKLDSISTLRPTISTTTLINTVNPGRPTTTPLNPIVPGHTTTTVSSETATTSTTVGEIVTPLENTTLTPISSNPSYPTLPPGYPDPEKIIYRLPTDIRPVKYRLYWHPDFETKTCEGYVTIQIEVNAPTNLVVLHAKDLHIDSVSILNVMAFYIRIRVKKFYLSPERELLIIELEELLRMSTPYVVNIQFTCQLSGLTGMYMSVYNDEGKGEERG
ncbi:uncharacterized protein [Eurosta solidaginis]|uniref:uncharacterized protein isoform X2 n=1 Tax=Eurosta solidaginis TaxID=178769 RepID=UPI003530C908